MDGGIGQHLPARIPDGTTSRMPAGDLHCTKFDQAAHRAKVGLDDAALALHGGLLDFSKRHRRRKIGIAELINEPWALPPYDSFVGSVVKEAFRSKGHELPRATVSSTSIQRYAALLAPGRFLAVRSASTLHLTGKRLSEKALPVDLPLRPLNVGIITLRNRTISPVARSSSLNAHAKSPSCSRSENEL
jgi:hypothetical protein